MVALDKQMDLLFRNGVMVIIISTIMMIIIFYLERVIYPEQKWIIWEDGPSLRMEELVMDQITLL